MIKKTRIIRSKNILYFIVVCLLFSYLLIYFFDIRENWQGTHKIWYEIFRESGPIENLQWFVLGLFSIVSAFISGNLWYHNKFHESRFWLLLSILGMIMVIEDTGNISHIFRSYVIRLELPVPAFIPDERIIVYAIYGLVALYPMFIYYKHKLSFPGPFRFLFVGYLIYGFISLSSASQDRGVIDWYQPAGEFLIDLIGNGKLYYTLPETHWAYEIVGYLFMDTVVEESIELIAAAFLLTGAFAFVEGYLCHKK